MTIFVPLPPFWHMAKFVNLVTKCEVKNDDKSAGYQVSVPDLPGCAITEKSIDLGMVSVTKAIQSHLAILAEYGEKVPNAKGLDNHRKNYLFGQ